MKITPIHLRDHEKVDSRGEVMRSGKNDW